MPVLPVVAVGLPPVAVDVLLLTMETDPILCCNGLTVVCASIRGPSICTVLPGFAATVCGRCTTEGLPTVAAVVVVTVAVAALPAGNNLIIFLGICGRAGNVLVPIA